MPAPQWILSPWRIAPHGDHQVFWVCPGQEEQLAACISPRTFGWRCWRADEDRPLAEGRAPDLETAKRRITDRIGRAP